MKTRLEFILISLSAFSCGTLVAFYINQHSCIRGFASDILIIIFIYSSIKIIWKDLQPWKLAVGITEWQ